MRRRVRSLSKFDREYEYSLKDALSLVKKFALAKFDESVDIAVNLGIDPRHADQQVRGTVFLPNGTGRNISIAVFANGEKADQAKVAGADIVGAELLIDRIQSGKIDFDLCIATPDMMPLVSRVGKILGPKGLMPNPKSGTVTLDLIKAIKEAKTGQVRFRAEKAGIVHAIIGKSSFELDALNVNIKSFICALIDLKPNGVKSKYIRRITLSTTMGPGIRINTAAILTS